MKYRALAMLLSLSFLAACNTMTAPTEGGAMPTAELMGQIPLPPGSKVAHEQSLILGAGENWVGRVVVDVGRDTSNAYAFFLDQYPRQGWSLLTSSRGKTSLIVFTKPDRNATIEISEGGALSGPNTVLTVSPRNAVSAVPPRAAAPAATGSAIPVTGPTQRP